MQNTPSNIDKRSLEVRRVLLTALHIDPANARTHPDENLDAIEASLRRFGQAEPLVVQAGTGRVVAGNGRLAVMRKLGWAECDVVELAIDNLTATGLGIALNRTAETAVWDDGTLVKLLQELQAEDALDGVGFGEDDIEELLDELGEGAEPVDLEDPGPEEPPEVPVSRPGDLWVLGEHRLLCGDATRPEDVALLLAGEKAVLMATDPPYCVDYTGAERPQDSGKDWSSVYREVDIKDLGEFLRAVLRAVMPGLIDEAGIYIWHAHLQYPVIDQVLQEFGILRHQPIIWVKPSSTFTYAYYRWAHEPCVFGWKKGHKPPHYLANGATSVWEVDWEGKARVVGNKHPTQKPLRLFEIPMEQHTKPGSLVLEPFSGSGSQIIAAEKLRRRCRAIEIQPAFVDVAVKRWEEATSKTAVLEATGESFAAVAERRTAEEGDHDGEAQTTG